MTTRPVKRKMQMVLPVMLPPILMMARVVRLLQKLIMEVVTVRPLKKNLIARVKRLSLRGRPKSQRNNWKRRRK